MEYPALERLEHLLYNMEDLHRRLSDQIEGLNAEVMETTGASGLVRVTANRSGRVERVTLEPDATRMAASELARELTATILRAQDDAAVRLRTAVREALGPDAPLDGLPG